MEVASFLYNKQVVQREMVGRSSTYHAPILMLTPIHADSAYAKRSNKVLIECARRYSGREVHFSLVVASGPGGKSFQPRR